MDTIIAIIKWCFEHWIITGVVLLFFVLSILGGIADAEKRRRFYTCDKCGEEEAIVKKKVEEIDRYPTYKEVTEKTASGKTKTRQVKIIKVKEKTHYQCKFCKAGFTTTNTRELK